MEKTYLVFDTETTGLPQFERHRRGFPPPSAFARYDCSRVVSIAWMLVRATDHVVVWEDKGLVRPEGFDIPAQATAIHGITTARALAEGEPFDDIMRRFSTCLSGEVVGHNVDFDVHVLGAELARRGAKWAECLARLLKAKRTCTMAMAKNVLDLAANPKLGVLHRLLFDEPPAGPLHDAQVDTLACFRCLVQMLSLSDPSVREPGFVPGEWIVLVQRLSERAALAVRCVPADLESLVREAGVLHKARIWFDTVDELACVCRAAFEWAASAYPGLEVHRAVLRQGV
jgi:DNA polymerase III epsilon subunit-like protein